MSNFSNETQNATQIYNYFSTNGWSHQAICGMLGNFSEESYMNPTEGELDAAYGTGYGLAQWSLSALQQYATQYNISNYNTISGQCEIIFNQMNNNGGGQYLHNPLYPNYWISPSDYITSTNTISFLTQAWMYNYERPDYSLDHLSVRLSASNYWDNYFNNPTSTTNPPVAPTTNLDGIVNTTTNGNVLTIQYLDSLATSNVEFSSDIFSWGTIPMQDIGNGLSEINVTKPQPGDSIQYQFYIDGNWTRGNYSVNNIPSAIQDSVTNNCYTTAYSNANTNGIVNCINDEKGNLIISYYDQNNGCETVQLSTSAMQWGSQNMNNNGYGLCTTSVDAPTSGDSLQ